MREVVTVNAWITHALVTVNARITWVIHRFLGITLFICVTGKPIEYPPENFYKYPITKTFKTEF